MGAEVGVKASPRCSRMEEGVVGLTQDAALRNYLPVVPFWLLKCDGMFAMLAHGLGKDQSGCLHS